MHTANLRKVGGSIMLAVPPAVLNRLRLTAGSTVAIGVEGDRLVVEPHTRTPYTLDFLLEQCDRGKRRSRADRAWVDLKPRGREL